MNEERRDALARVIEPDAWDLYDDPRVQKQGKNWRDLIVQDSRLIAQRIIESGLMTSHEWETQEYWAAKSRILERTARRGVCYSVEDGLDGYVMHDPRCPHWPDGANGGSTCIK